jgi:hypothetical protein
MVVGGYHASGDEYTIWNGMQWTPEADDNATALSPLGFVDVSCPTASFCVALDGGSGTTGNPSTDEPPTVGVWNAGTWTGSHEPGITEADNDVSCPTASYCVILGSGLYLAGSS